MGELGPEGTVRKPGGTPGRRIVQETGGDLADPPGFSTMR